MKSNLTKNKILFWLGAVHLLIFVCLLIYYPFNNISVLGINSTIKPMKFALSIWIFSWTMALILNYVSDIRKVKIYSWVAVISAGFEQIAITIQALRGELSHFNTSNMVGIIVFSLMGVFILILTFWTIYITVVFARQKPSELKPAIRLSILIGLIFFIIFSFFGGYISGLQGHTVGGADGGKGLWFLNWSTTYGDLRVAHFFGIHSLQIIPLFALFVNKNSSDDQAIKFVKLFALVYVSFVMFTLYQGVVGMPFFK